MISSAISRPVQWLMGRPEASGCSQARASIWHRWSAVIRGGAPGRGRSARRSSMLKSVRAIGCSANQRSRHRRAVSTAMPNSQAIWALRWPSAAASTIRPRSAICWRVLWRRTNCSRPCRSSVVRWTVGGFGPGMMCTPFMKSADCNSHLSPCQTESLLTPRCTRTINFLELPAVEEYTWFGTILSQT
jgi:hypothetical protein